MWLVDRGREGRLGIPRMAGWRLPAKRLSAAAEHSLPLPAQPGRQFFRESKTSGPLEERGVMGLSTLQARQSGEGETGAANGLCGTASHTRAMQRPCPLPSPQASPPQNLDIAEAGDCKSVFSNAVPAASVAALRRRLLASGFARVATRACAVLHINRRSNFAATGIGFVIGR